MFEDEAVSASHSVADRRKNEHYCYNLRILLSSLCVSRDGGLENVHASLPVTVLSFLSSGAGSSTDLLQKLSISCRGNGIFRIANHGVPVSFQESMMDVTRKLLRFAARIHYSFEFSPKGAVRSESSHLNTA